MYSYKKSIFLLEVYKYKYQNKNFAYKKNFWSNLFINKNVSII